MSSRMKIGAGVLVLLAVVGLFSAIVVVATGNSGDPEPPAQPTPLPPEPLIEEVPERARDLRDLTDSEREEVETLVRGDAKIQELAGGATFEVDGIGPWTSSTGHLIGAIVYLKLNEPVNYEGPLPGVIYKDEDPVSQKWYGEGEEIVEAGGITTLTVLVDLDRAIIASIEVYDADSYIIKGERIKGEEY